MSMIIGALTVAAGLGASTSVDAVTVIRDYASHGVASCQAALPAFDGNIRKRPLALSNEGTTNAFVTCDTESLNNTGAARYDEVVIVFVNRSAVSATVNCTLVDGVSFGGPAKFLPKTTGSFAAGSATEIAWLTTDNSGSNYRVPATSCSLPPGVEIGYVLFNYSEDVGA